MYYQYIYKNGKTIKTKEERTNSTLAEINAVLWANELGGNGVLIIKRRQSDYWGEYKPFLEIKQVNAVDYKPLSKVQQMGSIKGKRTKIYKLNPFKQYNLDNENPIIQELVWICETKKALLPRSPLLSIYNNKLSEIVGNIKRFNIDMEYIYNRLEYYECLTAFNY